MCAASRACCAGARAASCTTLTTQSIWRRRILSAMETGALLDAAPGTRASGPYKLHALGAAMTTTPGTFKGYMSKRVPYSYTLEYDRTLPPARQLQGNLKLLRSTLNNVARHGRFGARNAERGTQSR